MWPLSPSFPSLPFHLEDEGAGVPPTLVWVLRWEVETGWIGGLECLIEIMGNPVALSRWPCTHSTPCPLCLGLGGPREEEIFGMHYT